jgi:hypothetical protein
MQMTLEIIGAGFGRTGTSSLKAALDTLGFGPCCHGTEERHFRQNMEFWDHVYNHAPIDWDSFFDGYRSTIDSPSCRFYLELSRKYPSAKVILTTRQSDVWFDSYEDTVLPIIRASHGGRLYSFLFGNCTPNRESIIATYERHNREVQRLISPERLLVYDVLQGWEPLCRFLAVAIPDVPFPCSNSRSEFPELIGGILERLASESE